MVADDDLERIIESVSLLRIPLLAIGDPYQIPSPSQHLVKVLLDEHPVMIKADSMAFTDDRFERYELTEIVRQKAESPIIKLTSVSYTHLTLPTILRV